MTKQTGTETVADKLARRHDEACITGRSIDECECFLATAWKEEQAKMTKQTRGTATPGPWRLGTGGLLSRLNVWGQAHLQVATAKRWGGVDEVRQMELDAEAEANACLIAAAPELLTALKALTAVLATQGDELAQANIAYIPEWNDAEAAIKAAEGGE